MEIEIYKIIGLTFNEYVGRKIKVARIERKIKQQDFAETLGISKMGLSYIERGKRDLRVTLFVKIAKELKKPLNYFTED